MKGGKRNKRGTPQGGVISPLLANIYINRLLCHWKKTGACERLGQIVSYADDFVILCASRRQAEEGLALVSRWLTKLGLAIHPTKTRLCLARDEPFDFLGYTFRPTRHRRTRKRFITANPAVDSTLLYSVWESTDRWRADPTVPLLSRALDLSSGRHEW